MIILLIFSIILLIISIGILYYCGKKYFHYKEINSHIEEKNREFLESNQRLYESNERLVKMHEELTESCQQEYLRLNQLKTTTNDLLDTAKFSFERYCESLDNDYKKVEKEYEDAVALLHTAYDKTQEEILVKINELLTKLEKLKATRAAIIEAQKKEKEIQEQLDFYCLRPSEDELFDIHVLERVKPKLHQPRILCMLIWSTYFQKPMTSLCNNVLGTESICGIYKITNQTNNMCYIGQSVDIAKRWKEHAKCGLGIDTPLKNKLYKAMQEDGLENFSWELLEKCSKEELNEKEKFYIDLYQAESYGYNSNKRYWIKYRLFVFI